MKPLYSQTFPENSVCTLTLTDTNGYWGDRVWKGFGQTFSLTPENEEPMSWELINFNLFEYNGGLFSFTDRLYQGTDVTLLLWVKDIVVFTVAEAFWVMYNWVPSLVTSHSSVIYAALEAEDHEYSHISGGTHVVLAWEHPVSIMGSIDSYSIYIKQKDGAYT